MNNNTLDPNVGMTESIIHEHQLPKLIGPEKWRDLARMLDFSENDIDMIQAEKTNCPKECCIAVIVKWIHRRGRDATVGKLADALTKIELKNVADILLGRYFTALPPASKKTPCFISFDLEQKDDNYNP
ncbi:hypothetical protein pdam_00022721 [Pocillopora damicornis]|uniref:Death domain-containing protein n=1 Tax=Pocillopora damicornis TaxID=46731 RepID=A0A3M6TGV3_POCDA|nr:hypothetical protein pdam_00022721 [Pocillopora damicornis]